MDGLEMIKPSASVAPPKKRAKISEQQVDGVVIVSEALSADKKSKSKKPSKSKAQYAVPLRVIQCDECGAHFEKETSFFHHKKCHEFSRLALRVHIEQKRKNAVLPGFQNPLSPAEEAEYIANRKSALRRKKREVIHCYPPGYGLDVRVAALDKIPSVKVFNVRTQTALTNDLKPIPPVTVIDLDEDESEKSADKEK